MKFNGDKNRFLRLIDTEKLKKPWKIGISIDVISPKRLKNDKLG